MGELGTAQSGEGGDRLRGGSGFRHTAPNATAVTAFAGIFGRACRDRRGYAGGDLDHHQQSQK